VRITEAFELALKNIRTSKMRTFLTMLGIIIGVMAVIVIVGLGNGLSGYVTDSFSGLGTNSITVMINGRNSSTRNFDVEQVYKMVEDNSQYLEYVSPSVNISGIVKIQSETLNYTSVSGVSEDYFKIKDYSISQGRGISYGDIAQRKHVCVVGEYVNSTYFGGNAVGQTLRVGGTVYTVVGVQAQEADELEEGGTDDAVYLPYSTAARMSGSAINSYTVTMRDENYADESKQVIEDTLYETFADDSSYTVMSMSEMLESMTSMINMLVAVLAGIAAISLLVGGIGIMNIMLVSVTERTREIGVRKSLGAKERYILQQFVIEAAVTSALGGALGILLGYGLSAAASTVVSSIMEASFKVNPGLSAVMLAFGISAGIGVLFGYLPARKAARLNPIEALHFD
jgi:putative ABC transport system permease protein